MAINTDMLIKNEIDTGHFINLTNINGDKLSVFSDHIIYTEAVGKNTAKPFTFLFVKGAHAPLRVTETPAEIKAAV